MYKTRSYVPPCEGCGDYQHPRAEVREFDPELNFCNSISSSTTEPLDEEVEFEW